VYARGMSKLRFVVVSAMIMSGLVACAPERPVAAPASGLPSASTLTAPPRSIAGTLPTDLDGPFAGALLACEASCGLKGIVPSSLEIASGAPAALWTEEFPSASATLALQRDRELDYFGVVVAGTARLDAPGEKADVLPAWTAFRIPGGGASIVALSGGTRVVFAVATGGAPLVEAKSAFERDAAALAWTTRSAPITVVDVASVPDLSWANGAAHARVAIDAADARASLGVLLMSPDMQVAQHQHESSWEILGALRADGTMRRGQAKASKELASSEVKDGVMVAVPSGVEHAFVPGGTRPLVAVQLYVPPGPEQRFRKLAAGH